LDFCGDSRVCELIHCLSLRRDRERGTHAKKYKHNRNER